MAAATTGNDEHAPLLSNRFLTRLTIGVAVLAGLTLAISLTGRMLGERIALAGTGATIHLLGGRYGADNAQTTGATVVEQLQAFRADRAILTVAALDPELGAMDASLDEAQIARAMMRNARTLTVLADASKFGRQAAYAVCSTEEIDLIISDNNLDKAHREALRDKGVEFWT